MNYSESDEYGAQQAHRRSSKKGAGDPKSHETEGGGGSLGGQSPRFEMASHRKIACGAHLRGFTLRNRCSTP